MIGTQILTYKTLVEPQARLIAVSKTHPISFIEEAYQAGQRLFGENKALEMRDKQAALPPDIEWHFIGHLQSNKIKTIIPFVTMIHSIDSEKLLIEIQKEAAKQQRCVDVLLQIYLAQEETKFGLSKDEAQHLLQHLDALNLSHIRICGLMGIASNTENQDQIAHEFDSLHQLFEDYKANFFSNAPHFCELSMGMTHDYPLALNAGSTLVRIGSAIFGHRNYAKNA